MARLGSKALGWGLMAAAALALVALPGCGDDEESPAGSGGTTTNTGTGDPDSLGAQFAGALCEKMYECCDAANMAEVITGTSIEDYAGCRIAYRTIWEGALEPQFAESAAAGRLDFNKASFSACMESLKGLSCADFAAGGGLEGALSCEAAFVPRVQAGGACSLSQECVTGRCLIPSGESEGSCVDPATLAGEGGACDGDDECAEGLYCDQLGACAAPLPDGAACSGNEACEHTCVGDDTGDGVCARVCEGGGPGVGEPDLELEAIGGPLVLAYCDKFFDCCSASELEDELGLFDDLKTCRTFQAVVVGGLAMPGLHNAKVKGTVEVDAPAWMACIDAFEASSCADFARHKDMECGEAITGKVADGSACEQDLECVSGFCEKPTPDPEAQGTCQPPGSAGGACTSSCVEGHYCDAAGVCQPTKALGEACTQDDACAEGSCAGTAGSQACALTCDGA